MQIKRPAVWRVFSCFMIGGETGIRTLDDIAAIHAFQACPFNRSGTSPDTTGMLQMYNGGIIPVWRAVGYIRSDWVVKLAAIPCKDMRRS